MQIALDGTWLTAGLLIATRIAGLLLTAPVLALSTAPRPLRVVLVSMLALALGIGLGRSGTPVPASLFGLGLAMTGEFLAGAVLGFAVLTAFAAMSLAGQLLDFQIGFNAAALFDIDTQAQNPLLSAFFSLLAGLLFIGADGHLGLFRAVAYSLEWLPLGRAPFPEDLGPIVRSFGTVFTYGFVIAAPVVLGLFLVDVAIAVIARTLPQINIYFITLPLKLLVGLSLLAVSLVHLGPVVHALFAAAIPAVDAGAAR